MIELSVAVLATAALTQAIALYLLGRRLTRFILIWSATTERLTKLERNYWHEGRVPRDGPSERA